MPQNKIRKLINRSKERSVYGIIPTTMESEHFLIKDGCICYKDRSASIRFNDVLNNFDVRVIKTILDH